MNTEDFILSKATLVSTMTYEPDRYGWDVPCLPSKVPGIYFIVREGKFRRKGAKMDILKVGKAEGVYGLRGRIQSYTSTSINRKDWDRTIRYLHTSMQTLLNENNEHCKIKLYCMELPMTKVLFEGYELETSMIRSLEKTLSIQATQEGHSMLLSGQD
jgi:hypothetical protein